MEPPGDTLEGFEFLESPLQNGTDALIGDWNANSAFPPLPSSWLSNLDSDGEFGEDAAWLWESDPLTVADPEISQRPTEEESMGRSCARQNADVSGASTALDVPDHYLGYCDSNQPNPGVSVEMHGNLSGETESIELGRRLLPLPSEKSPVMLTRKDMNDPEILELYSQLLLFSKDWKKDKICFFYPSGSKRNTLDNLALKLNLNYEYHSDQEIVDITRPASYETFTPSYGSIAPKDLSSELESRSSNLMGGYGAENSSSKTCAHCLTQDVEKNPICSSCDTNLKAHDVRRQLSLMTSFIRSLSKGPGEQTFSGSTIFKPSAELNDQQLLASLDKGRRSNSYGSRPDLEMEVISAQPKSKSIFAHQRSNSANSDNRRGRNTLRRPSRSVLRQAAQKVAQRDLGETPFTFDSVASSLSRHVSPSPGRRGPLDRVARAGMRALKGVGACWRCKILRKKCDPESPCKACPRPDVKSSWQTLGCRRGALGEEVLNVILCPKSASDPQQSSSDPPTVGDELSGQQQRSAEVDEAEHCLAEAASRRKDAIKEAELVFGKRTTNFRWSFELKTTENILPFTTGQDEHSCGYLNEYQTSQIRSILWELLDNSLSATILVNDSIDDISLTLTEAVRYEADQGDLPLVTMALVCLSSCLDVLRLSQDGLLTASLHDHCTKERCAIACLSDLDSSMKVYLLGLSRVVFRKENLQNDRRWWLSIFYSLYIQSYVRKGLLKLDSPCIRRAGDIESSNCDSSQQYLHLVVRLFTAIAAGHDPLTMDWVSQSQAASIADNSLFLYYKRAQKVVQRTWAERNITSSFDYLRYIFEIDSVSVQSILRPSQTTVWQDPFSSHLSLTGESDDGSNAATYFENFSRAGSWYGTEDDGDMSADETSKLREFRYSNLFDDSPANNIANAKRRANSPPQQDDFQMLHSNDSARSLFGRRVLASQYSPGSRRESYSSTHSFAASSMGSTYGRLSLGGISPSSDSSNMPFLSSNSGARSPSLRPSLSIPPGTSTPLGLAASPYSLASENGAFVCDCCPKKPKKFNTQFELTIHEQEKSYKCQYCPRRFKYKTEAERHENSLHLRKHSWSCAHLSDYSSAFHRSSDPPCLSNVCGYCGEEFLFGDSSSPAGLEAQQMEHLKVDHQFGECNRAKKFFRADHFRQHLKHSHAGTHGRWTSMLENACMKDEPPVATRCLLALSDPVHSDCL